MADLAISFKDVSYRYQDPWKRSTIEGVRTISLDINEGEAFGFLGHNGAGKTTTIKCILDLIRPSHGTISILGVNNREPRSRLTIGYVPEQPYFHDYLSVRETVETFASLGNVPRGEMKDRVYATLARLDLTDHADKKVRALSKGLTQRMAIAQAIVAAPKILILDEPFSGLDPIGRKQIRELLLAEKNRGTTIFMCTHVLSDVERICDRASIMAKGQLKGVFDLKNLPALQSTGYELVVSGSIEDSRRFLPQTESVRQEQRQCVVTFVSRETAERAITAALENKLEILSFAQSQGTLEDLFATLVTTTESDQP